MRALSIRAPWWWMILHAGKDVENREWFTRYRGPVLIHASKWWRAGEVRADIAWIDARIGLPAGMRARLLAGDDLFLRALGGHVVGRAEMTGCVRASPSPWFQGTFGFELRAAVAFSQPIPCQGELGLFRVPAMVAAAAEGAR